MRLDAHFLGVAECDDCGQQLPCHLSAWGNPARVSRCNVCGGDVSWAPAFDDTDSGAPSMQKRDEG